MSFSYEITGSIAVIQVTEGVNELELARRVMSQNKNVKTVAVRTGEVEGPYRIKRVRVIAGENTTLTMHKENGVRILIDLNKAYYSPRLQTERQRITRLVKDDELIIDMFCGVGPFSITIAKNTKASQLYAIDHNPDAIALLKDNISLNKVDNIIPLLGNAIELIKDLPKADRIIMNAPRQNNLNSLSVAFNQLRSGGVIHYYTTSEALPVNFNGLKLINQRTVIKYAPGKSHECLDLKKV